ncbi:MAG: hypothetical protein Q4C73_00710 [Eubacteriales bacterium]|nr:hypothetical protein [Eubacteriales bacterium]
MFRKLWKYEWTAMMRSMFPIYGAVLAVSAVYGFILQNSLVRRLLPISVLNYAEPVVIMIYAAAIGALVVFSILMTVQRFYKGLLKQEGYLMFTLPVRVRSLVLSKACVSLVMGVCSVAVAVISVGFMAGTVFVGFFSGLQDLMAELISLMKLEPETFAHGSLFAAEFAAAGIAAAFAVVYRLYLAMSLGQLSGNHKAGCSILWYVAVSTLRSLLGMIALGAFFGGFVQDKPGAFQMSGYAALHVMGAGLLAVNLAELLVYLLGTEYLLKNRLNLE